MTTAVTICSNALLELGASPIASFDETGNQARLAANLYPPNRDALLRSHTWNCCVKRVSLSPLVGVPAYGFAFAYQLPGDWVRTIKLGNFADYSVDFRQEGRQLLCSANSLQLRYVFRNTNEGTWDDKLVEVMTALMKWRFAYPITKSTSLRDTLGAEYRMLLQQAKSIDSMEEPSEQIAEESPLISVRN